jgi:hypothetical protein
MSTAIRRQRKSKLRQQRQTRRNIARYGTPNEPVCEIPPKPLRADGGDTVILACSGPQLNDVDIWAPGLPVAAVSTAIRSPHFDDRKPDYWVLVDNINQNHDLERGHEYAADPEVIKACPVNRLKKTRKYPSYYYARRKARSNDKGHKYGANRETLLSGANQSVLFAAQWLPLMAGYTRVVFAGCDLADTGGKQHCHPRQRKARDRQKHLKNLNLVHDILQRWTADAAELGISFLSWTPESRINDFMEPYQWTSITSSTS